YYVKVNTNASIGSYVTITYRVDNECSGTIVAHNIQIISCGSSPQRQIEAFPNPANGSFDVTIIEPADSTASTNNTDVEFDAELYDKFIQKVKSGKSQNGKLKIITNGLAPGLYYLNVFKGNDVLRKQILVE